MSVPNLRQISLFVQKL